MKSKIDSLKRFIFFINYPTRGGLRTKADSYPHHTHNGNRAVQFNDTWYLYRCWIDTVNRAVISNMKGQTKRFWTDSLHQGYVWKLALERMRQSLSDRRCSSLIMCVCLDSINEPSARSYEKWWEHMDIQLKFQCRQQSKNQSVMASFCTKIARYFHLRVQMHIQTTCHMTSTCPTHTHVLIFQNAVDTRYCSSKVKHLSNFEVWHFMDIVGNAP